MSVFFFWGVLLFLLFLFVFETPSPAAASRQTDEKVKTIVNTSAITTPDDSNSMFNSLRLISVALFPKRLRGRVELP